jgi:YbgC/YbaW family acyl-CoA thioester hydrolase
MSGVGTAASTTVRRRIEWSDTDASGHYHYATALRLFEAAESELLERLGMLHEIYGRLPRVHVSFDFRRTLHFRDAVDVAVSVLEVGRTSVTYSVEVLRGDEHCIDGRVVAVLLDASGTPSTWPEDHRARLERADVENARRASSSRTA